MLGDFYSPKQPQRGTIQKDTDMAGDCYKKALAAGAAEAQQRLDGDGHADERQHREHGHALPPRR